MADAWLPRTGEIRGTDVIVRDLSMLSDTDLEDWRNLAQRALEPNPFQEPEFVLPLSETLLCDDDLRILTVVDSSTGHWLAAWVLHSRASTFSRPLAHLRALESPYSFLDSPLIDRQHSRLAIQDMLRYLNRQRVWHGLRLSVSRTASEQAREWDRQASRVGLMVDRDRVWSRAVTDLPGFDPQQPLQQCSRSRRKSLLKARRWLESQGG